METTKYETGRLGMSEPEISAEMESLLQLIMTRDPEAQANRIAYFYLHTPQEIHRVAVLNAMRMATSCLVYRDFGGWLERRVAYMRPYSVRCNVPDPKFLGSEEQRQAHALSVAELDAIWHAQSERLQKAAVVRNVVGPEEEGGPYHGVRW
jgi:hypothetical protein